MSRRKGELSNASIDRQWPHQIALKAPLGKRLPDIRYLARSILTGTSREITGRSLETARGQIATDRGIGEDWVCIAFKEEADALAFRDRFGGIPMKPADRPEWPS